VSSKHPASGEDRDGRVQRSEAPRRARDRRGAKVEVPEDPKALGKLLKRLEKQMLEHARNLEFEQAAEVRDRIREIREERLLA